ncbi:MAG: GNAT family N-acetyltransferase [Gammaproteobacteria bacterium]
MDSTIRDNKELRRYELEKDGKIAFVKYTRKPGIITFMHAEVPEELSGHGIGTTLVRGVLDIARANGDKVIPICPFIAAYMRQHKETQDLLADPAYLEIHATK